MAMKRRNRKRGSKVASPPTIPSYTEKPAGPSVGLPGADRRTHPRYEFTAGVEVVATESGARIETRVRDLSQQGCYVDTNNPLPLGTVTEVRITKGAQLFEARARVVYSRASKGMGLMFATIEPAQLRTLEEPASIDGNPSPSLRADRRWIAFRRRDSHAGHQCSRCVDSRVYAGVQRTASHSV
ncbi:MAG: hypothetical protein DMG49_19485 [Acidobacteria bacterium]|nr:MAG: hypothetical protein DMG49_19485 [Acidobacteriota bacterium]